MRRPCARQSLPWLQHTRIIYVYHINIVVTIASLTKKYIQHAEDHCKEVLPKNQNVKSSIAALYASYEPLQH